MVPSNEALFQNSTGNAVYSSEDGARNYLCDPVLNTDFVYTNRSVQEQLGEQNREHSNDGQQLTM
jgi:hypothetical protein